MICLNFRKTTSGHETGAHWHKEFYNRTEKKEIVAVLSRAAWLLLAEGEEEVTCPRTKQKVTKRKVVRGGAHVKVSDTECEAGRGSTHARAGEPLLLRNSRAPVSPGTARMHADHNYNLRLRKLRILPVTISGEIRKNLSSCGPSGFQRRSSLRRSSST